MSSEVKPRYDETLKSEYDDWEPASILTARKVEGWFDEDGGELYVEDVSDVDTDEDYLVKYREERFNPEIVPDGRFRDLDAALGHAEDILEGEVVLE